jgi:hypothetical protein
MKLFLDKLVLFKSIYNPEAWENWIVLRMVPRLNTYSWLRYTCMYCMAKKIQNIHFTQIFSIFDVTPCFQLSLGVIFSQSDVRRSL